MTTMVQRDTAGGVSYIEDAVFEAMQSDKKV